MLTADKVKTLTTLDPTGLAKFLASSGYTGASFKSATFIGITNGGQFCYQVVYYDDTGTGENEVGKVFLEYDHVNDSVTADY
jgi:hypothetical protein